MGVRNLHFRWFRGCRVQGVGSCTQKGQEVWGFGQGNSAAERYSPP